ncbi:PQQ-binding-like beta-propeller repeat protein [Myroides odoratimimus]|uniref:outer membrane protein assembly factor BamB family protein n=1 Tax=Myroides odoratimimus TaxID=76832 RepID=UPI001CE130C8|nr:PQQ-binding-like beta-propeller repeat protein [Myroides odoratimimus]MCA4792984.1 PQQ-binding-like beta-propeller repeat protein [Myroides odoratimimus]MCA4820145.1 PQQ-binding-like beta-propeller repeat protein [Myroides odoratimimus]MDM1400531.1 PQQ-binding-like beta-propeller repeat protein [Myroides odoratimimus]MDM1410870.1 PQQ-binding-like beta-propeller repeat protein [Myroides odoratimimus]MDM1443428.1 PQQ-binding-like beta-propeller repeat protein [Myroides odoratimimus]
MKKLLVSLTALFAFFGCQNKQTQDTVVNVSNQTVVFSSSGKVVNFDLDNKKVVWEYTSAQDEGANRNKFTFDENTLYMPFESGKLVALDFLTGKEKWVFTAPQTGVMDMAVGDEGSNAADRGEPYFMSQPLQYQDKVYMVSIGGGNDPYFYVINKTDGSEYKIEGIETKYNLSQPVLCQEMVFVNSGIYLNKYSLKGTGTSYGMYEGITFDSPLYAQMRSDGETLYFGEEDGMFYAIPFNENADVKGDNDDIMDPKNNFKDNLSIYKWRYQSKEYSRLATNADSNTALYGKTYVVQVRKSDSDAQALIGLNAKTGEEQWSYGSTEEIVNWHKSGEHLIGYTMTMVFVLDFQGKELATYPITEEFKPLTNIEETKDGQLVFLTTRGVTTIDKTSKQAKVLIAYETKEEYHNTAYIKYFKN